MLKGCGRMLSKFRGLASAEIGSAAARTKKLLLFAVCAEWVGDVFFFGVSGHVLAGSSDE